MNAFGVIKSLMDRFHDWRVNSDWPEIEAAAATWANALLSANGPNVLKYLLDDIETYMRLRESNSAKPLRSKLDTDAAGLASFDRVLSVICGFVWAEPQYGREYLSDQAFATGRIEMAIAHDGLYGAPGGVATSLVRPDDSPSRPLGAETPMLPTGSDEHSQPQTPAVRGKPSDAVLESPEAPTAEGRGSEASN